MFSITLIKYKNLFAKGLKYMYLINKLASITEERVHKYGAQYYTLAIFGLINYPLAYLYELLNLLNYFYF